jgi:primase-polymerase (primpol)-like protein
MDLLMMSRVNARNMYRILINALYVNKQEFSASIWISNQGYTKMNGQPTIKAVYSGLNILSVIALNH